MSAFCLHACKSDFPFLGDYSLNPYCFQRKWPVKKGVDFNAEDFVNQLEVQRRQLAEAELLNRLSEFEKRQIAKDKRHSMFLKKQTILLQKLILGQKTTKKGKNIPGKSVAKKSSMIQTDGVNDSDDDGGNDCQHDPEPNARFLFLWLHGDCSFPSALRIMFECEGCFFRAYRNERT